MGDESKTYVLNFLGIDGEDKKYSSVVSSLGKEIKIDLPGESASINAYDSLYILLKQMEKIESSLKENQKKQIENLKNQLKKEILSQKNPSIESYDFSLTLSSFSTALFFIKTGTTIPPLQKIKKSIDLRNEVLSIYNSFKSTSLAPIIKAQFDIKKKGNKFIIGNEKLLSQMIVTSPYNFSLVSLLREYKETDQSPSDFMKEYNALLASHTIFSNSLQKLVSKSVLTNMEANRVFEEANSFITKSLYLHRDGRLVSKQLLNLLGMLASRKSVEDSLIKWRDAVAGEYLNLYKGQGIDFGSLPIKDQKMLSVLFTPEQLKNNFRRAVESLKKIEEFLKPLHVDNVYDFYLESPVKNEIETYAHSLFINKGYNREESYEIFKSMIYVLALKFYADDNLIKLNGEDLAGFYKDFIKNLPNRNEVVETIKTDLKQLNPEINLSKITSDPLNIAQRAVILMGLNYNLSQVSSQSTQPTQTTTTKVKQEVSIGVQKSKVSVYINGKEVDRNIFDLNQENLVYLSPFSQKRFDEISFDVKKLNSTVSITLNKSSLNGESLSMDIGFYLAHVLNDVYARTLNFSSLSNKNDTELISFLAVNYSSPTNKGKKKIKFLANSISSLNEFSSKEEILSSKFIKTKIGDSAKRYADAFVASMNQLEPGKFKQEQLDKMWRVAYLSFVVSVLYEFNLDKNMLGSDFEKGNVNFDNLMELSKKLDSFIKDGVDINLKSIIPNMKIGSGVTMLNFKGGTSLWVIRADGSKQLLAYTKGNKIVYASTSLHLNNSDHIVLLYHKSNKDLSKLASDEENLWKSGTFYAHSTALRFVTHNYRLLSKKTLYEVGFNTSSILVNQVRAKNYEEGLNQIPPKPITIRGEVPLPLNPQIISLQQPREQVFVPYYTPKKIENLKIVSLTINSSFSDSAESIREHLKALGLSDEQINQIVKQGMSNNEMLIAFSNLLQENPQIIATIAAKANVAGLQQGDSSTYTLNFNGKKIFVSFERVGDNKYHFAIYDENDSEYCKGDLEIDKDTLKLFKNKKLSRQYVPRFSLYVPGIVKYLGKRFALTTDLYVTAMQELGFKLSKGNIGKFSNWMFQPSAVTTFNWALKSGPSYNISAFSGLSFGYNPFLTESTISPFLGFSLNKYLVNTSAVGINFSLALGAGARSFKDFAQRGVKKLLFGSLNLGLRFHQFGINLGTTRFFGYSVLNLSLGWDKNKDGVIDFGVGGYHIFGGALYVPTLIINGHNLVGATLDYARKGVVKVWNWLFKPKEKEKEEKQSEPKQQGNKTQPTTSRVVN